MVLVSGFRPAHRHPTGANTPPRSRHPPGADTPPPGADSPLEQTPPPRETAIAADSTHPTGMRSCYIFVASGTTYDSKVSTSFVVTFLLPMGKKCDHKSNC